ncbi:NAD(P)H-dependent flavin oxidoreductase [Bacillus songklensis]|uniref:Probable nitronate monooxygenase n=1 Tax=Bacillus songklensis TaxID=1069116 RepID=A0ABV8AWZ3_9BACI
MSWNENVFIKKFKITYPIVQAGMAGGITTPELVAAVSNYGALGSIGAGYMSASEMAEAIRDTKQLTNKPFNVNVFVPSIDLLEVKEEQRQKALEVLKPYFENLNIREEPVIRDYSTVFNNQIDAIIEEGAAVCSFTFGAPPREVVSRLKEKGVLLIGTATTAAEAIVLEESGMDAIVAQGSEAGGHRGSFPDTREDVQIGIMSLLPRITDCVTIPVIAAGGIMDGRGINAALSLGAQGVQLGTIFLATEESGAHPVYKEKVINSDEQSTMMTKAFSGKYARGIRNTFMEEMEHQKDCILPYPMQHDLTSGLRKGAAARQNPNYMSLWAGQGIGMVKQSQSVIQVLDELIRKMYVGASRR